MSDQGFSQCRECRRLAEAQAEIANLREIVEIARGLTLERDETRQVYIGVSGDHKDAALLAAAFTALDNYRG